MAVPGGVKYTGMRLIRSPDGLAVDQEPYVQGMRPVPVETSRRAKDPLGEQETEAYRSLLGALQWTVQRTRPDMAFRVAQE